jgi:hypothetical protein
LAVTAVGRAAPGQDSSSQNEADKQKKVCGQYCLVSILQDFGKDVQLAELLPVAPAGHGTNLAHLKVLAEAYGLKTMGAKVTADILFCMKRPTILHVSGNHFIALLPDKAGTNFTVVDPPQSHTIKDAQGLTKRWKWKGDCLLIDEYEMVLPDPKAEPGTPKIFVDNPIFDAGTIFDDTKVISPTFKITNRGSADLVIEEIKTDCGCTTAALDRKEIRPGESIPVTIVYHLRGRFGRLAERKTMVKTNDPKSPHTVLVIKAQRRREFAINPPRALLGTVPMGTEKILLMRIAPGAEDRQLSIEKAQTSSASLEVAPLNSEFFPHNPKPYLLKICLLPSAPPGLFNEVVRIPCIGASREVLEIPVRAEILGPIRTSLSEVHFGLVRSDEKEKIKRIYLRSDENFDIESVAANQPWLDAAVEKIDANQYSLVITMTLATAPKGTLKAAVTVTTNLPQMASVKIPVFAFGL